MSGQTNEGRPQAQSATQTSGARAQDAIYQGDRMVARVTEAEVDLDARELRLGEVYESDLLMIPEECEYQKYRILIQRIGYATKIDKVSPHKGRILRGVVADILGYREQ
ncbi:MAG TPA: hypothetical protein VG028_15635 [Terriglobia bacterium]|nr:hypothetical protein [Terriglobia bacterium]